MQFTCFTSTKVQIVTGEERVRSVGCGMTVSTSGLFPMRRLSRGQESEGFAQK
jgi:hypothetical protein